MRRRTARGIGVGFQRLAPKSLRHAQGGQRWRAGRSPQLLGPLVKPRGVVDDRSLVDEFDQCAEQVVGAGRAKQRELVDGVERAIPASCNDAWIGSSESSMAAGQTFSANSLATARERRTRRSAC